MGQLHRVPPMSARPTIHPQQMNAVTGALLFEEAT